MRVACRMLVAAGLLSTGCSGILGLDEFGAASGDGGGSSTSGTGGSAASTTSSSSTSSTTSSTVSSGGGGQGGGGGVPGTGGAGGGGEPCDDEGATEPCYDGDPATIGVGECVAGERTCAEGTWTACEGQVVPREEDLTTWADESCTPGDMEVQSFVRYAGTNDDYIGGSGWLGGSAGEQDAVVAIGTYGELTIGGETVSTEIDSGTALVRHRPDGSVVWVRGLSTAAPSGVGAGNGAILLRGHAAEPETIDGVTLDGEFLALVDGDGTFRDVVSMPANAGGAGTIYGFLGAYGFVDNTLRRYRVHFDDMTISTTTDIDFGTQRPTGARRTSNPSLLVVTGKIAGAMTLDGCVAQTTADDSFIAVFSGSTQPVCVSLTTLGVTGSSTITGFDVAGDRLYVSGYFSGTLIDESGASLVSEGDASAFVARMTLNADGQLSLVWLRAYGGTGLVRGGAVMPEPTGGLVWTVVLLNGATVDIDGVPVEPVQALVGFDPSGGVRYVRQVGPQVAAGFRQSEDLVFSVGDLTEDSLPFGIDPLPPPGGLSDAFFAVHAAP